MPQREPLINKSLAFVWLRLTCCINVVGPKTRTGFCVSVWKELSHQFAKQNHRGCLRPLFHPTEECTERCSSVGRGRGVVVLMLQLALSGCFSLSRTLAPSAGRKRYCRPLGNVCNYVFINHYTRQTT